METVGHWRVETFRVPRNLYRQMLWVLLYKSRWAKSMVSLQSLKVKAEVADLSSYSRPLILIDFITSNTSI